MPETVWGGKWKRVVSKKFRHRIEHQVHRESEAGVMTVRHICRSVEASDKRHLVLSDAMSVVLAGSKGRSNSAILARRMQKIAAMCLPVARIKTSPASIKHLMPMKARISITHGLMIRATMAIEKGHPCGMPQSLRNGSPTPPARQLYTSKFSR